MERPYVKSLEKIATQLELSLDKPTSTIYGVMNGYKFCLIPFNETYRFTLKFSLKQENELPDANLLKEIVAESKSIVECQVQGHQVFYVLKTGMTANKSAEKLQEVLPLITQFLASNYFQNCCQNCGAEGEDVYNVAGTPVICCETCFKEYSEAVNANEQAKNQKKENIVAGLVGAFLGSVLGVIAIIVLGQLGYVAALSGIVLAICSLKGYELLGGKLSKQGIIGSSIIMIIMVYVGMRLDWSISVASYYQEADVFSAFRLMPQLLSEGYVESSAYYGNLAMLYLFTALGAIPTILNVLRNRKLGSESYKLS
ncbi:hypothetical protein DOK78_002687 [Enterococcus sp. DIV2402]|uniref:Uncharacterized protein n=1 Tax=Candidatus Enterococcus lowellii TaxID=2230877 RepID=A0ABZ2SQH1_9ENTE|nr:hypothetical protein [Enterococcus sp. DIV2402]MBO0465062.1 hypothetical protein [Enterococcus sp. DIV2402]